MVVGVYYRDINTNVGDAYDVRSIVENLAKNNKVYVFCSKKNKHKSNSVNIQYIQTNSLLVTMYEIHRLRGKLNYMHLFCGFIASIPLVAILLRANKIKYAYSPFGQLMPLAVNKNKIKKSIFLYLILKRTIRMANFVHANSKYESKIMKKYGAKNVLIAPLSIEGYEVSVPGKLTNKNTISYIGRLDIWHKGLDFLIYAVQKNYRYIVKNNLKIVLAGRGNKKDIKSLRRIIELSGVNNIVTLKVNISEEEKIKILDRSCYFFHPSRVEGFARSMREAISAEVPIITTYDSNIGDLINEYHAGLVSECNKEDVSIKLHEAIEFKDKDFQTGLKNMKIRLTWINLNEKLQEAYKRY